MRNYNSMSDFIEASIEVIQDMGLCYLLEVDWMIPCSEAAASEIPSEIATLSSAIEDAFYAKYNKVFFSESKSDCNKMKSILRRFAHLAR